ncbi:MAG: hypothetical protein ACE10B_04770 [Phycisphaerales bacterium]
MHCRTCDYPLWNLTTGTCPECGTAFRTSDFEFVANSVRFCCPHCNQAYYGTGKQGHLVPEEFDCVSCRNHIRMDEMVLLPAEGVQEQRTIVDRVPWLERKRHGWIKAWLLTVKMSLFQPVRLARSLPTMSRVGQAWRFAPLSWAVFFLVGVSAPLFLVGVIMLITADSDALGLFVASFGVVLGGPLVIAILIGIWGLTTHGVLKLTGGAAFSIARTYEAICYSAGANAAYAFPCLGPYCGSYFIWIWWVVGAVLMVATGQRVHGGRAALAVLTFPVSLILLVVGGYVAFFVAIFSGMGTMSAGMTMPTTDTQIVLDGVLEYASGHDGQGPGHALQLVTSAGLSETDFVTSGSTTGIDDVPAGDADLVAFMLLSPGDQAEVADAAAEALPQGTIAHRLGDFVFTYHGLDLTAADPGLWVVVQSPDPDVNSVQPPWVVFGVGRADGTVITVGLTQMAMSLQQQNAIRAASGLPPLPNPAMVTHDAPAVADADRSDM